MLRSLLSRGADKTRLRHMLLVLFLVLAVPTGVLIAQAFGQLKWAAHHQARGMAEELTQRVDVRLSRLVAAADQRSFADYSFLVVSGSPDANFLGRSPLSTFPVSQSVPGALGYFQVDANGNFSTPLLPPDRTPAERFGIDAAELEARQALARQIHTILAVNALVRLRKPPTAGPAVANEPTVTPDTDVASEAALSPEPGDTPELGVASMADDELANTADRPRAGMAAEAARSLAELETADSPGRRDAYADGNGTIGFAADADDFYAVTRELDSYSQQAFDRLAERKQAEDAPADIAEPEAAAAREGLFAFGDAGAIREMRNTAQAPAAAAPQVAEKLASRAKRREQTALLEAAEDVDVLQAGQLSQTPGELRINMFESEVDPLEFSRLDSGHLLMFRKVWRDGERFIQGIVINPERFLAALIDDEFRTTALAGMSALGVAFDGSLIRDVHGNAPESYLSVGTTLDGTPLYRSRLTTPLDRLELIFTVTQLPRGPGAGLLAWITLLLALAFCGGFYALYRLGSGQLELARQQQDFVSAVSHELKTPLTSIRMYGEMLREGWVSEDKRQTYYEFIHDEAERLTRLITNVLQLARMSRDELAVDKERVTIGELFDLVASKIGSQAERAGFDVEIAADTACAPLVVDVDKDCFLQIVINLVDNAIKFSQHADRKRIDIGAHCAAGEATFSVRDYGPGIPDDQIRRIFRLFYRSESELTRETAGTGIGLAIVQQLSLAMGGSVSVQNCDPGAEFRLVLPCTDGPVPADSQTQ